MFISEGGWGGVQKYLSRKIPNYFPNFGLDPKNVNFVTPMGGVGGGGGGGHKIFILFNVFFLLF